jgi:preprotein translocase subunit YajC
MVGALLTLLVLVLFYRVVYSSMQGQASKAKKNQQNYETQISSLQHQLKIVTGGGGSGPTKGVSKDELAAAVPPAANEAEFLRIFNQIADASGVTLQQVTPTNPQGATSASASASATTTAGVQTISLGITIQGDYGEVQDYVNRLVHAPRLLIIDSENVTSGASSSGAQTSGGPVGQVFAGQGSAPLLTVQLTARIFTLAAASSTATGTAGAAAPATPAPSGVQNS